MERILVNTPPNSMQHAQGFPYFTLECQNNQYQVTDLQDDQHWVWDKRSCKDAIEVLSKYAVEKSDPEKVQSKVPVHWNSPWDSDDKCRAATVDFYYNDDEICSLCFSGGNEYDWTDSYIPRFSFRWSGKNVNVSVMIQILSVMQPYIDERSTIVRRKI